MPSSALINGHGMTLSATPHEEGPLILLSQNFSMFLDVGTGTQDDLSPAETDAGLMAFSFLQGEYFLNHRYDINFLDVNVPEKSVFCRFTGSIPGVLVY